MKEVWVVLSVDERDIIGVAESLEGGKALALEDSGEPELAWKDKPGRSINEHWDYEVKRFEIKR